MGNDGRKPTQSYQSLLNKLVEALVLECGMSLPPLLKRLQRRRVTSFIQSSLQHVADFRETGFLIVGEALPD